MTKLVDEAEIDFSKEKFPVVPMPLWEWKEITFDMSPEERQELKEKIDKELFDKLSIKDGNTGTY